MKYIEFAQLREAAAAEVGRLIDALPEPIRDRVSSLPVVFDDVPGQELVDDGLEPDLLGLFVGDSFSHTDNDPIPAQIILFLGNIWEESGHDMVLYRREVRKTLLHEWGHYLGWDEDDLFVRGLA